MYDGKQVLRVQPFKTKDLYNIGVEMTKRKGTGNYDKEREEFNLEYVPLNEKNLYQEVKKTLERRNIDYLNKPSTNMINGITFTSGNEFFEALGMKFKDTDRTYKKGDKAGQIVKVPDINCKEDIPQAVSYYFDSCMDFLKEFVGEENIVLAQIHYDEDTPHLQAYFMPIVHEVERKCFVKDEKGNVVKEEYYNKKGELSSVPKLMRDDNGKIIYETHKGVFLNNDQFWKAHGGKNSYARLQDKFNEFITERGFKLDRGNIGANIEHKTKLEYQIEENKAELKLINKEKEQALKIMQNSKESLVNAIAEADKDVLNPIKRKVIGYKDEDINKLVDYSKNLEKVNAIQKKELSNNEITIKRLKQENDSFKNNKELRKRDNIIKEQKIEINRLNDLVEVLSNNINILKRKLKDEVDKWKGILKKVCNAIDRVLHKEPEEQLEDYEDLADSINYDYYDKKDKKKDDFELGM